MSYKIIVDSCCELPKELWGDKRLEVIPLGLEVGDYQSDTGMLPVKVSDIKNMESGIQSVLIAVWTKEDQSDLQWIQMEADEEGNYRTDIDVQGFEYQ